MTYHITIPGRLPGMNEYTAAQRTHRQKGARMKKDAQGIVSIFIRQSHTPGILEPVRLHFRFFEPNRKRDLDNISGFAHKVIQDALVSCGVLSGDGWKYIVGYSDTFSVDKQHPRIEVEIEEVSNGGP